MWPWKRRYSLEELAAVVVLLVRSEKSVNRLVEATQGATSLGRAELAWEVVVLCFFYARVAIMANLREYRPAIEVLHRVFFEALQRDRGMTETQMAELENWMASRISDYTKALNSAMQEGGDIPLRVGVKFAEFAGLPGYGLESLQASLGAAAVGVGVKELLESVRIVVR